MAITYILNIVWSIMFCFLCIVTFVYTIFWRMCSENIEDNPRPCLIDLAQFRKSKRDQWTLPSLWPPELLIKTFFVSFSNRFPFPQGRTKWGHENLWKIRNQSILQGWCWTGRNDVHFGNTLMFADHFEFGALFDVLVSQLRTHTWPREIPRASRNTKFKWHGIQCGFEGTLLKNYGQQKSEMIRTNLMDTLFYTKRFCI